MQARKRFFSGRETSLSLGIEDHSGTDTVLEVTEGRVGFGTTQAAYQLLKINPNINFVGNVEGRDMFNSKADVIICDGFTGNVALKMGETFYEVMNKRGVKDSFIDMFNYASVGGSPILGVNGNVIIGHGVSSPEAIKNMMNLAVQTVESKVSEKIKNFYQ